MPCPVLPALFSSVRHSNPSPPPTSFRRETSHKILFENFTLIINI
jgi:hypothetical protein